MSYNTARLQSPLAWLWLALIVFLGLTSWNQLDQGGRLEVGLTELVPDSKAGPWEQAAEQRRQSNYERRVAWMLRADDPDSLEQFNTHLNRRLHDSGFFQQADQVDDSTFWSERYQDLYKSRIYFLTEHDRQLLSLGAEAYLNEHLKALYSPLGASYIARLQTDPAGLFTRYFQTLLPITVTQAETGDALRVFKSLDVSPVLLGFSNIGPLYTLYLNLQREASSYGVTLRASGAPLYTAYAVASAQREIKTIGIASLLLIIVLVGALFRSPVPLGLTLIAVSVGFLGGLSITLLILDSVHILTLVFGATIIGIGADYSFHYLVHTQGRKRASAHLSRSLLLGMTSSVAGFLALLTLNFPWLQQIGLFMASGLVFSCLTVLILFPLGLGSSGKTPTIQPVLTPASGSRRRYLGWILAVIIASLPGLSRLEPSDDVRELYSPPKILQLDEQAIAAATEYRPEMRYVLVRAPNLEDLLLAEERLVPDLQKLRANGKLQGFSAFSQRHPSHQRQQENMLLQQRLYESTAFADFLNELGFIATTEWMDSSGDSPLQAIENENFLGCDTSGCSSAIYLSGLESSSALQELLSYHPEARLVDRVGAINQVLGGYRVQIQLAAGLVIGIVLLILTLASSLRIALKILLLPLVSGLAAMACVGYFSEDYSIVNLMALILIMGLGLDYAIFRTFTPAPERSGTSLAILLSVITSLLAFGLLALSETRAIHQFGVTISSGLIIAWFLSGKIHHSVSRKEGT